MAVGGRAILTGMACMLAVACGTRDRWDDRGVSRTLNEHGVAIGQRIAPIPVTCGDSVTSVGAENTTQLVTFATLKDCSSCETHMSGLDFLEQEDALPEHNIVVVWLEPGTARGEVDAARKRSARTVCLDSAGQAWDALNLQHTPVTALIRSGSIVYLHDQPLSRDADRRAFLTDVRRLTHKR